MGSDLAGFAVACDGPESTITPFLGQDNSGSFRPLRLFCLALHGLATQRRAANIFQKMEHRFAHKTVTRIVIVRNSLRVIPDRRRDNQAMILGIKRGCGPVVLASSPHVREGVSYSDREPIETHRRNLMQKLGLHNTTEIVLYAVRKGIVKL